jgi:hypothetical protein
VRLAQRCGLPALVAERVHLPASPDGVGAFPAAKVMALVAEMAAGADSIADMDRLRHGASHGHVQTRSPCSARDNMNFLGLASRGSACPRTGSPCRALALLYLTQDLGSCRGRGKQGAWSVGAQESQQ